MENIEEPITIMIHDHNPWDRQDRSALEIAWQLNKEFPLEIHSYSVQGYENWPNMEHILYKNLTKKPLLFKYLDYHYKTWQRLKKNKNKWIQSTGIASLKSHIIQVQFIHHTWLKIAENLSINTIQELSNLKKISYCLLSNYKLKMERFSYTPDKKYIAISHSIKKELMETFNIPAQNIEIIHHGVDCSEFFPAKNTQKSMDARKKIRENLNIKESDQVILHVGTFNSREDLIKIFETLSYLKENGFSNLKFITTDSGGLKTLDTLKKEFQLENEIIFIPHSKDIRNYYWASDLFFYPTFYEPFGLATLEAMACGLPVVISSLTGVAELIKNGESGLLFNPNHSAAEISQTLALILKDPELKEKLSRAGRKVAEQRSWEHVGKEYQDFYKKFRAQISLEKIIDNNS